MVATYRESRPGRLARLVVPRSTRPTPVHTHRTIFWVYLFACLSLLGLLNFEQLSYVRTPIGNLNGDDLLLAVIVLGSAPAYWKWRKIHGSTVIRALEIAWLTYVLLLALSALRAPVQSTTELFVDLRFVSRFTLFFPSVVNLNTAERRRIFLWFSVAIAAVGTLFNIGQATLGPVTLFDSPIYIVDINGAVGDLYRVYLQITNYIVYVFFLSICASIVHRRILSTAFAAFLSISFLVIYARSLWIGIMCGLATLFAIYVAQRALRGRAVATYVFVPVVLLLVGLALSTLGINAFSDVINRINDGAYSFTTDSGTWGTRTDMASLMLSTFDWNDWLMGAGLFGTYWSDFGIIDVFLHLGATGCLAVAFLMVSSFSVGISTIVRGIRAGDRMSQMIGGAVTAFTVTLVAYSLPASNFLQPYTMSTLAVATALASAVRASSPPERTRAGRGSRR